MKRALTKVVLFGVFLLFTTGFTIAEGTIEDPATVDPLHIKWFGIRGFPGEDTPIQAMLESLLETKLGYPVRFELSGGVADAELHPTIDLMLAANELPDVFLRFNIQPEFLEQAATKFTIETYKSNMPRLAKRLSEIMHQLARNENEMWAKYQNDDGLMWGSPRIWEWGWIPNGQMWRLDKLEALGYGIPTTLAEAEEIFAAYKTEYPDEFALTAPGRGYVCFELVLNAYGLTGLEPNIRDGRVFQPFAAPEFREILEISRRWYEKGYWDPDFVNHGSEWRSFFADGKYLVTHFINDWDFYTGADTRLLNNLRDNVPGAKAVAARHLAADENTTPIQYVWEPFLSQLTVFGKHLESDADTLMKIMAVADLISMDRAVNYLASDGIEGIHYQLDEDGLPKALPAVAGKSRAEIAEQFGFGFYWSGVFSSSRPLSRAMRQKYQEFVFDKDAIYGLDSIDYHFHPIIGPVTDESGEQVRVEGAVGWLEMAVEIVTGAKPVQYYDEWLETYYDSGGREWENHANRLYGN